MSRPKPQAQPVLAAAAPWTGERDAHRARAEERRNCMTSASSRSRYAKLTADETRAIALRLPCPRGSFQCSRPAAPRGAESIAIQAEQPYLALASDLSHPSGMSPSQLFQNSNYELLLLRCGHV